VLGHRAGDQPLLRLTRSDGEAKAVTAATSAAMGSGAEVVAEAAPALASTVTGSDSDG
jgi:hypothetical protein